MTTISIPLFLTQEYDCSYLDGEQAQSAFVHPTFQLTTPVYSQLIEQGFRRSGNQVYVPKCLQCSACIPARLAVNEFKTNRNQKRCLKKNSQTQVIVKPPVFERQHYDMYIRYQNMRHGDGSMAHSSPDEYLAFLGSSWCDTRFVEFSINNELAGIAVVDYLDNALSAVYTFFDPELSSYSLGVYAVLWQIEQAKRQQLEYLYLGFWIKNCKKMSYKSEYQPLQLFINNCWTELTL
jgi:arginyl-tRNA--protein-N-Asp/Glu arginylyltransferase